MASSNVRPLRAVTVVLSFVTAILGGVSHFDNPWIKTTCTKTYYGQVCSKPYEMCYIPEISSCPKIETERYFVSMVCICCVLSTLFLIMDVIGKPENKIIKTLDTGYHVVAAVLLIVAAALYFISAEQINAKAGTELNPARKIKLRYSEKLAAAGLTLLQSLLYVIVACYIY